MYRNRDLRNEAIIDLRRKGSSLQEIGDAFGLTRERVRQIVEKYAPEANVLGKEIQRRKKTRLEPNVKCFMCGAKFRAIKSRIEVNVLKRFYCSHKCLYSDVERHSLRRSMIPTKGAEAYNLRKQGLSWLEVKERVFPDKEQKSGSMATLMLAKRYANRNSLPWPLKLER